VEIGPASNGGAAAAAAAAQQPAKAAAAAAAANEQSAAESSLEICCANPVPCGVRVALAIGPALDLVGRAGGVISGTTARILISLVQVLRPLGAVFDITYPSLYRELLERLERVVELEFLSINVTPLQCTMTIVTPISFHHKLYSRTLVPLCVYALCYLFAAYFSRTGRSLRDKPGAVYADREAARRWEGFGDSAIGFAFFFIFLLSFEEIQTRNLPLPAPRPPDQKIDTSSLAAGTRRRLR
jgi:hypothetical protein